MKNLNPITGKVILVGNMEISGKKLTGIFIETEMEDIENLEYTILYQKVKIDKIDK